MDEMTITDGRGSANHRNANISIARVTQIYEVRYVLCVIAGVVVKDLIPITPGRSGCGLIIVCIPAIEVIVDGSESNFR